MRPRLDPIALFVDRPVLTMMASLAIVMVGIIALFKLPLRLVPSGISADSINVYVPIQRDMPPREVEDRVLEPLEEQFRTIPGVAEISGRASSDGTRVTVTFENGVDPDLAAAEIRDRVQRARLEWPDDIDRYFSWREDPSSAPLAFFQVQTPNRDPSWDALIDEVVRPRLEAVDGVGRIEVWGLVDETLRILFDRDKLEEHRIDYGRLLAQLRNDNFTEPVGELDDGRARYLVRVDAKFRDAAEIENYPIRPGLVIGDIARVEMIPSVRDSLARFDRKFTYTCILRLASGTNPVDASKNVRAAMTELEKDPELEGIGFRFLFDQGAMIEESLDTLVSTSIQGGVLALVALFVFLRNVRLTLAVALSIPLTLLIAAGYLFFSGRSLNILTMAGMTLAVGMVVDNSVVVLENIRRRRGEGYGLRQACIGGTREMVLAITMATLTTVVVLLPLAFMGSNTNVRTTLAALGMPLSVALLGSLGVALLLLPAAMRQVGTGNVPSGGDAAIGGRFSPVRWLAFVTDGLLGLFTRGFLWRVVGLVFCGLVAWSGTIPGSKLDLGMGERGGGPFQGGDVRITLEIGRGRTLGDVARLVESYEDFLFEHAADWDIEHVATRFGRDSARFDVLFVEGTPREEFNAKRREILAAWPREPGVTLTLRDSSGGGMGGGGGGAAESDLRNFVLRIWGPDSEFLAEKALEIRDRLANRDEIATVEVGEAEGNQQVVVAVDRDRADELGVGPDSIERTMASGLRGMELTRFEDEGREIRLIAQYDAERDPTLFDLKETRVWRRDGTYQRIDDLAEIRFERALQTISRKDGKTNISIVGERAADVDNAALADVLRDVMASTPLPRGYSWSDDSATRDIALQLAELLDAGFLGFVLVFLLMAILFESLVLPLAIVLTVPFLAITGAYWSLWAFLGSLDVMGAIGMVLLVGIVVNNGIVLLDCIERLRRDGYDRVTAIREGVRVRLRPIVMTAVTTVVGLLPMAIFGESTGEGISYVSMSIAVSGGLTLCTLFTCIAVPLAYTLIDDVSQWSASVFRKAFPRPWAVPAGGTVTPAPSGEGA